ncbi:hypothetical protein [Flavihumibacter petaseus]|uniref:Uncharacterized protein n=1 Tax=Flavihumibacter petaseus NBRC 106054 TaxID=1220578 RepID=A0A0E9N6E9_9BACT|nr:hypothetical protein [Flavihumibacter petaseus]GAO45389.1 hypothetical protein FPE01S_05_00850 [Flavihumibacter petaseus NBRC 106054]
MAKSKGLITGTISGMIGKELVFRDWEEKVIVAKAPGQRSTPATAAQEVIMENFTTGATYAKNILQDPLMAEAYRKARKPRQNLYSRALQDFVNPPVVKTITAREYTGAAGDKIVVRAEDDFRVDKVFVEILAAGGNLLENGFAVVQPNGINWTYTATLPNAAVPGTTIRATATDVPGNETTLEIIL